MSTYKVTFTKLGRGRPPEPQTYENVLDANHLAARVYETAKPKLLSSDVDVIVDLEAKTGFVTAGFHIAGNFTVEDIS